MRLFCRCDDALNLYQQQVIGFNKQVSSLNDKIKQMDLILAETRDMITSDNKIEHFVCKCSQCIQ